LNTSQCIVTVTQTTKETNNLTQHNQYPNDSGLSYFVKIVQTPVPEGPCLIRLEIDPKKRYPIYIYNPSKEPTPEELKKYYQKIDFNYNSPEKPHWVLVNNTVWLYKKKTGGSGQVTLQSPKNKDKYNPNVNTVNSNGGFYYNVPVSPEKPPEGGITTHKTPIIPEDVSPFKPPQTFPKDALLTGIEPPFKAPKAFPKDAILTGIEPMIPPESPKTKEIYSPGVNTVNSAGGFYPNVPSPYKAKPDNSPKPDNLPKSLDVNEDFVSQVDYLVYLLKAFRINPSPQLYSFIEIGLKNIGPDKK
jgi:hypothetical protein